MTIPNQSPEELDTTRAGDVREQVLREHGVLEDELHGREEAVTGDDNAEFAGGGSRVSLVAAWIVGGVCTVMFGFSVWAGIGNLIGIPAIASALDQTMAPIGWTWLIILVALPVLTCAAAFLLGLGRRPWTRVLILIVGLGVLSCMQLNATHIMPLTQYFL